MENIFKKFPTYERKYECGQTRFSVEELREKEEKAQRKKREKLELDGTRDNIINAYEDDQL